MQQTTRHLHAEMSAEGFVFGYMHDLRGAEQGTVMVSQSNSKQWKSSGQHACTERDWDEAPLENCDHAFPATRPS